MSPLVCVLLLTVLAADRGYVRAAPFSSTLPGGASEGQEAEYAGTKSDLTVAQLEKLKSAESSEDEGARSHGAGSEPHGIHLEMHRFDAAVKQGGELVSRVSELGTAAAADGRPAHVHTETAVDVPGAGVHRVLVADGTQAPEPQEPHKETKVFRGAARLVQPSSVAGDVPPPAAASRHTSNGNRRSFNADITRETNSNMDHFSSYTGVQYSPLDMAEYVFWTGDERGVTAAIEEFLQEGMMSKDEAISFLQEIKYNIDYLKAHYSQQLQQAREDSGQQEKMRSLLLEQAAAKEMYNQYQYRSRPLQSFPFAGSPDILRSIASTNYELGNNLVPSASYPSVPAPGDYRPEPVKRMNDPMLQTNIIGTSDYDREGAPLISEEDYEQAMDKLRAADSLYTQYTLEEVIYQLAKMMFVQSLSREPVESRHAMQRFMSFLELEAQRGQLSRNIEKKVLDVMIAALSDTVAEHPELLQARDGYPAPPAAPPANRLMHHMLEMGASEPTLSRAILAAYKDELTKGQLMQKRKGFLGGY